MNTIEILRAVPVHGQVIFYLIILFSIVSFAIIIDRFVCLRRTKIKPEQVMKRIDPLLRKGKILEAVSFCDKNSRAITRIIKAGILKHDRNPEKIKEAMTSQATIELLPLERYLPLLASIAYIAPLLGFAGTILGMMDTFFRIQVASEFLASGDLAGGIAGALFTTAAGIVIAVPSILAHNFFRTRIDAIRIRIEQIVSEIAGILQGN